MRSRKRRKGDQPLVMVTAYDEPGARIVDEGGVDIVLVGDSVANNVLGLDSTLDVTVADMAHHLAAVARARPRALVVGDLPWMSYHLGVHDAVRNAATLVRSGAEAVKLEGGRSRIAVVEGLVQAEIPVMAHLGLTPQSVLAMGGYHVQGKSPDAVQELLDSAKALAAAGCFCVVLEGIPDAAAAAVTESVDIPTIGIGAGPDCDGQVLVFHDLLGLGAGPPPRFARAYADLAGQARAAVASFATDVRGGAFPTAAESYRASDELRSALGDHHQE